MIYESKYCFAIDSKFSYLFHNFFNFNFRLIDGTFWTKLQEVHVIKESTNDSPIKFLVIVSDSYAVVWTKLQRVYEIYESKYCFAIIFLINQSISNRGAINNQHLSNYIRIFKLIYNTICIKLLHN